MYMDITPETAMTRHPELVAEVMAILAKGKSKERGSAPETLTWRYSWSLSIKSISLGQMLNGEQPQETRTLDERIHCVLVGGKGRWSGCAGPIDGLHPVPPEVMAKMQACLEPPTPLSPSKLEAALRELNPTVVVLNRMSDTLTRNDITGFIKD